MPGGRKSRFETRKDGERDFTTEITERTRRARRKRDIFLRERKRFSRGLRRIYADKDGWEIVTTEITERARRGENTEKHRCFLVTQRDKPQKGKFTAEAQGKPARYINTSAGDKPPRYKNNRMAGDKPEAEIRN